jgi:predicted proteasome-type protease
MTPKDKAKELVDSYKIKVKVFFTENSIPIIVKADMILESAIQCALIAVDEIIKSSPTIIGQMTGIKSNKKYWQKVKQEIEKL